MKTFAMVGAGNVAWHLSQALANAGFMPLCVFGRHLNKADELARLLKCKATDNLMNVDSTADFYVIAVKDDAIANVAAKLISKNTHSLYIHTAGSVGINVFAGRAELCGVLYPLQSFTKSRMLDFAKIPLFVEGNSPRAVCAIKDIAKKISDIPIVELNCEKRKFMHLAAVFASNFTNDCYACAANVLKRSGVSFSALYPLMSETLDKVRHLSPVEAQTGPAVRYDINVMKYHEALLDGNELEIYRMMSKDIHEKHLKSLSQDLKKSDNDQL